LRLKLYTRKVYLQYVSHSGIQLRINNGASILIKYEMVLKIHTYCNNDAEINSTFCLTNLKPQKL